MDKNFRRIAIVNRGEPARRLITAVRELNRERDLGLATIALYTDPDRRAMFVRDADEAFHLGTATYVDERDGERKSSYLDYQRLERALTQTRAEAVWVGWGFVAEHAAFVDLCEASVSGRAAAESLCRRIQQREWELLFDHSFRHAAG